MVVRLRRISWWFLNNMFSLIKYITSRKGLFKIKTDTRNADRSSFKDAIITYGHTYSSGKLKNGKIVYDEIKE